jgi:hypothetical protein
MFCKGAFFPHVLRNLMWVTLLGLAETAAPWGQNVAAEDTVVADHAQAAAIPTSSR